MEYKYLTYLSNGRRYFAASLCVVGMVFCGVGISLLWA